MRKILKNTTSVDITLSDIGKIIPGGTEFEIPRSEFSRFEGSLDTITAIQSGDLIVGDGYRFFTDPLESECYLRSNYGGDAFVVDGNALRVYTPDLVTDPPTGRKAVAPFMNLCTVMRELYNPSDNPGFLPGFKPLLGSGGVIRDLQDRTLNLEVIHGKTGWHNQQIKENSYRKPENLLIYYGYPNSFNSTMTPNSWDNEKVSQDMARYSLIILGDGVADSGHPDYPNSIQIFPRLRSLNQRLQLFGYINMAQSLETIETKIDQWLALEVNGIFFDQAGYDFGNTREHQNNCINHVHSMGRTVFVNAWNIDHVIGTDEDISFPNSTYNPNHIESTLGADDWFLLESLAVNTLAYSGGYEPKNDWSTRIYKSILARYYYGINLAGVCIINNDNSSGQGLFDFAYVSALMGCLDGFGSSDHYYGASSAQVKFWDRPDLSQLGRLYAPSPSIQLDANDADVYLRYLDFGRLRLDFSSGSESYAIDQY